MPKVKVPEKVQRALAIALVVVCFVLVVGGIFWIHYSTLRNAWELKVVEERGIEIEALVLESTHSPAGGRSLETYTLDYEYEVNGKRFFKSKYVDRTYIEGGSVTIKYLPENPKVSDIPGNTGLMHQWVQMIVFDVIAFFGIIVGIFKYIIEKRKEKPPVVKDTGILDDIDSKK